MENTTQPSAQNEPAVVKFEGPKMDAKLKARWVNALRSGKYKQGTGRLRVGDMFCCLGVICDLVAPKSWDENAHEGMANSFPSARVLRIAGVSDDSTEDGHPFWKLSGMNDDGKSFSEIADYIETNL